LALALFLLWRRKGECYVKQQAQVLKLYLSFCLGYQLLKGEVVIVLGRRDVASAGAGGDAVTTATQSCLLSTTHLVSLSNFLAEGSQRGFLGLLEDPAERVGVEAVNHFKHSLSVAKLEVLKTPNAVLDGSQVMGLNNSGTSSILDGILVALKLALELTPVHNHLLEIGTY
jgi:hypothetical protein